MLRPLRVLAVTTLQQLPDRLRAVLAVALSVEVANVAIENSRSLTASVNRIVFAFDAVTPSGRRTLVLNLLVGPSNALRVNPRVQAQAQMAAAALGVPVARVVASDDSAAALGHPFLITEMAKGVSDHADVVAALDAADPRAGRAALLKQCARALAAIHRIDVRDAEKSRQDRLKMCRLGLDRLEIVPASLEWAFRWLVVHQPPPSPAVLLHGDYKVGNFIVDETTLTAVLDWEWLHVGEHYEDLAWFCVREWRGDAPPNLGAGGLGSIERFLSAYEEAAGTTLDRAAFHWWRVMATLLRGITRMSHGWSAAPEPSIRSAQVTRRLCEVEWDLLDLLDAGRLR